MLPELMHEKVAAARLGVSLTTLQRVRRAGEITFVRINRKPRYRVADLQAYVDAQTVAATKPPRKLGKRLQPEL